MHTIKTPSLKTEWIGIPMVEKDGEDIEMLSDDWKRTGHAI